MRHVLAEPSYRARHAKSDESLHTARMTAAMALGRLDGLLRSRSSETLDILAVRLLREVLIGALRQQGHSFTEARFYAWFSGITTLSDDPSQSSSAARSLVEVLLSEMTHSRWMPLACVAGRFQAAFLAIRDPEAQNVSEEACAALEEAKELVEALGAAELPFAALEALHQAIGQSAQFAKSERATDIVTIDNMKLIVERPKPPSPRWAIELVFGTYLRNAGVLHAALPMPGLIRLDAVPCAGGKAPEAAAVIQAQALRDCIGHLISAVEEALRVRSNMAERYADKRLNSRAPQLFALLAGYGPLRSSQLERLLGATRAGVQTMLRALARANDLSVETISGVKLYSLQRDQAVGQGDPIGENISAFSKGAVAEYDASLARIDQLLARQNAGNTHNRRSAMTARQSLPGFEIQG
jgi:hypothetical protein